MKHLLTPLTTGLLSAAIVAVLALGGCASTDTNTSASSESGSASSSTASQGSASQADGSTANPLGTVSNALAADEDALVNSYASAFEQKTYEDGETGKSVTYNLYLPAGYDASKSYPMVVFIADSSCTGDDATRSLTQGLGGVVWASEAWQAANPSIVCVPTYPETILDDHNGYTTTDYVELTKRLIDSVSSEYAVDTDRVYGTGQSMGCMTTLILASEYPDLYAACMFVDGQWDVSALKGLEGQKFVYFAAEDDASAYAGMQEVMGMFDADSATYTYEQWDGTWNADELSAAAAELFAAGTDANFVSWKTGTIEASGGQANGNGGGPRNGQESGGAQSGGEKPGSSATASEAASSAANADGSAQQKPERAGGMGGASYHMASFDYAYNCITVMEWLFQQGA